MKWKVQEWYKTVYTVRKASGQKFRERLCGSRCTNYIKSLKHMKNNKSHGSDGYTAKFFNFFWKDIKYCIVKTTNCIFFFGKKEAPISQRLGVISCLPKGYKPRQFCQT